MIKLRGYDDTIQLALESGNEHVFAFWKQLSEKEKIILCENLKTVDYSLMQTLYCSSQESIQNFFSPAPYIPLPETDAEKAKFLQAAEAGKDYIQKGRTAAFVVAGGQGSRLGYEGPKGKYPIGTVSGASLFEIFAGKIRRYCGKYKVVIPWLVMTSPANHAETEEYFREKNFFGLGEDNIYIFPQNMIPSLDSRGKLILKNPYEIFKNPDGHGGSLSALASSGVLSRIKSSGIELISYFQVDNPLIKIIDPFFIGFHNIISAEVSSKAMKKAYPAEKLGVFVITPDGKTRVIEYSDLPAEKAALTKSSGDLEYSAGSIAIHLFNLDFIQKITSGETGQLSLQYHRAQKTIKAFTTEGYREIEGLKFEKFVFDSIPLAEKSLILEIDREEEFAPVKNPEGVDSAVSSRELMSSLHRKWLKERRARIPAVVKIIEIAADMAVEANDLPEGIDIPPQEKVYVDQNLIKNEFID